MSADTAVTGASVDGRPVLRRLHGDADWPLWRAARVAALTDASYAYATAARDWPLGGEEAWRARLLDTAQLAVVASFGDASVGLVRGVVADGTARLHSLWVDPTARRGGLARELVQAVEAWARPQCPVLELDVLADNNAALATYERLGFTTCRVARLDDGRDLVTMSTSLATCPPPSSTPAV